MALYDNRHWLLSHIRNSFISSDETGMWEAIIINEKPKDYNLFTKGDMYPHIEESDDDEEDRGDELCNSFEIQSGGHRQRTDTAQRLEKMEQEKRKAAKIKRIKWECSSIPITNEEREQLFERKIIKKGKQKSVRSMLTDEIEKCPLLPKNPFSEYAKFDGNAQVVLPTRTYKIFLTMLPLPEREFPLHVCVLGLAKVSELIGFVCWKYMTQNTDPNFKFRENVDCYGLFIAEDDGEVDWDFSCLDPKETVGKFGLAYLAMVDLGDKSVPSRKTEEIKAGDVDDGSEIVKTKDSDDLKQMKVDLIAIESLLYQSYHVYILNKMRGKAEVVLGISGDKIEIDPVVSSHTKVTGKFWKQKALSYGIHLIVSCELLESKSSNRASFRIVHYSEQDESLTQSNHLHFKNHDFEGDQKIAEEIVRKVNHILHLKCGTHRKEYLAFKQKKLGKRNSFSIWPR